MTLRRRIQILIFGGSLSLAVLLASCAHPHLRRGLASEDGPLQKIPADFTLIRHPEFPLLVRVYQGTKRSKIVRVGITNPEGKVACQNGAPSRLDAPPAQSGNYLIDTNEEQDVFCFPTTGAPPVVTIHVDYFYAKSAFAAQDADAGDVGADAMQKTLRTLEKGEISQPALGVLQSHGQVSGFYFFARTDAESTSHEEHGKAQVIYPEASNHLVPGDFLRIKSISGRIGATRMDVEKAPYDWRGLPTVIGHQSKDTDPPVVPNPAYRFPAERPWRLICTLQDGDSAPKIVFRGGDALLSTQEAKGNFRCQINLKATGTDRPQGFFTIAAEVIRHASAVTEFGGIARSADGGKAARDQQADDLGLSAVNAEVKSRVDDNYKAVTTYNRYAQAHNQNSSAANYTQENNQRQTDDIFPLSDILNYRRGAHTFQIVPLPRYLANRDGPVDNVDYMIEDSNTPYYPENSKLPIVTSYDNYFAPVGGFMSAERWSQINQMPWEVTICPEKLGDAAAAFSRMASDNQRWTMSTRKDVESLTSKFGARNATSCDPSWFDANIRGVHPVYEPMYFQRQSHYRFVYVKEAALIKNGRVRENLTVYSPDRVEALYTSPAGGAIFRVFSKIDNNRHRDPANRLWFFEKGRQTDTPVSGSGDLPKEVSFDDRTLFPTLGSDGIPVKFPKF